MNNALSSEKKTSIAIIIAALCIHGSLGSLLFLLEPHYDLLSADQTQVILVNKFSEPKQAPLNKPPLNEPQNVTSLAPIPQEEWGEMLGRQNNFGLPNGETAVATTNHITSITPQEPLTQSIQSDTDTAPQKTLTEQRKQEKVSTSSQSQQEEPSLPKKSLFPKDTPDQKTFQEESFASSHSAQEEVREQSYTTSLAQLSRELEPTGTYSNSSQITNKKLNAHKRQIDNNIFQQKTSSETLSKHKPSDLTLASIGRGFIEQTKYNGTHNVTMLGKKGGAISAEQLKIERYVERLSWCLQNSFKLLRRTIDPHIPGEAEVQVYLQLSRAGIIEELKLLMSSGNTILDQHTLAVFKDAGTSFPPVPTYIKATPFAISYHIDYGIAQNSAPLSFSFKH